MTTMQRETMMDRGVTFDLQVGTCGHPRAALFKCPDRRPDARCVLCLVCRLRSHDPGQFECSSRMGDRADYDSLPEMDPFVLGVLDTIADKARKYDDILEALGLLMRIPKVKEAG